MSYEVEPIFRCPFIRLVFITCLLLWNINEYAGPEPLCSIRDMTRHSYCDIIPYIRNIYANFCYWFISEEYRPTLSLSAKNVQSLRVWSLTFIFNIRLIVAGGWGVGSPTKFWSVQGLLIVIIPIRMVTRCASNYFNHQ